jgi:hypothetical protein
MGLVSYTSERWYSVPCIYLLQYEIGMQHDAPQRYNFTSKVMKLGF